jgi:RNA polymerase sigma factor (sigma-70 family)
VTEVFDGPPDLLSAADLAGEVALQRTLIMALAELPLRQRAVLVLRYFDDLTEEQVAAALEISIGTVKSTASRALSRLRALVPELAEELS